LGGTHVQQFQLNRAPVDELKEGAMRLSKLGYELGYRLSPRMPYETGPPKELVELVESGRIPPCRAIDLGCGRGSNAVYLAQHGFKVTGVDFISSAIAKAKQKAEAAGVQAEFIVDDLTNLQKAKGTFGFLMDIGSLDVLLPEDRDLYVRNVLPLTHPGSRFLLSGWEWSHPWWQRRFLRHMAFEPGEIDQRFGEYLEIERIAKAPGFAVYLMTRRSM
jgi:2-polyprenyl-3-methyl-5-hydroxy-6-metoxy-1,4-benzoquinol methylase